MKKVVGVISLIVLSAMLLAGCTESDRVTKNISKEADNFNVTRRVTVYNMRTDKILLEVIGNLSVKGSSGDVDLLVEVGPGQYKKHFIHLNSWTTYVVEDISGAFVDKYHYEVNILPEMIQTYKFTFSD